MLKNITMLIFSAILLPGCVVAGVVPIAITGGLLAGSTAAYIGTPSPSSIYDYLIYNRPRDKDIRSGPHYSSALDAFWYENTKGETIVGVKNTVLWQTWNGLNLQEGN